MHGCDRHPARIPEVGGSLARIPEVVGPLDGCGWRHNLEPPASGNPHIIPLHPPPSRFLFRRTVRPCSEASWPALLALEGAHVGPRPDVPPSPLPSPSELLELRQASRSVALDGAASDFVLDAVRYARSRSEADGLPPPSDRRLVRTARALRIAAHADGRGAVGAPELLLLPHLLCARGADADALERWVEEQLEQRGAAAGAVGYILTGLFGRVWDLAIRQGANQRPPMAETRALAAEARALLCAAASEAEAPGELTLSLDPPPLWLAPDTARRAADALSRATCRRRERLGQVAQEAARMACALEASAGDALCPASLLELLPRLATDEVLRMLQDDAGEEQQRQALWLLSDGMGLHVNVDVGELQS